MKLSTITAKRLIVAGALLASMAAATVSAQPARNPSICIAKQLTCIRDVVIMGRWVCVAKRLDCIRWL